MSAFDDEHHARILRRLRAAYREEVELNIQQYPGQEVNRESSEAQAASAGLAIITRKIGTKGGFNTYVRGEYVLVLRFEAPRGGRLFTVWGIGSRTLTGLREADLNVIIC